VRPFQIGPKTEEQKAAPQRGIACRWLTYELNLASEDCSRAARLVKISLSLSDFWVCPQPDGGLTGWSVRTARLGLQSEKVREFQNGI
jgi:hypothetical protein